MVYYAKASLELARRDGAAPNFIIPTGNLGNALACVWAREAGLPIGEIVLASNANLTVPDFLASGEWRPRPSVADAGVRHGRRQPEQHGAAALALPGRSPCCAARSPRSR